MAYIIVAYQRLIEGECHQNQRRTHRKAQAHYPMAAGGPLPAPLCQQAHRTGRSALFPVFGHPLQLGPHGLYGRETRRPPGWAPGCQQQRKRTPERRRGKATGLHRQSNALPVGDGLDALGLVYGSIARILIRSHLREHLHRFHNCRII